MIIFFNGSVHPRELVSQPLHGVCPEYTLRRNDVYPLTKRLGRWVVPRLIQGFEGV